jgi:hypothetical protein
LYECETRSLAIRKETRLTVYENNVVRRMFGPEREREIVTGPRLRNGELLYQINNYYGN